MTKFILLFVIVSLSFAEGRVAIDEESKFDFTIEPPPPPPPKSCKIGGKSYKHGESYKETCFIFTCLYGRWKQDMIRKECAMCWVYSDPFIQTFDKTSGSYVWHGTCNYTFVQPKDTTSDVPSVHGLLKDCGWGSCLSEVTYKASDHVVITISYDNMNSIKINGNTKPISYTVTYDNQHNLFVFRDIECIYIQEFGPRPLSLQCCPNARTDSMKVYADDSFKNKLVGLCGYYSGNYLNDYILRDGSMEVYTQYPKTFPISWLSLQQPAGTINSQCKPKEKPDPDPIDFLDEDGFPGGNEFYDLNDNGGVIMQMRSVSAGNRVSLCFNKNEYETQCKSIVGGPLNTLHPQLLTLYESCVDSLCDANINNDDFLVSFRQLVEQTKKDIAQTTY